MRDDINTQDDDNGDYVGLQTEFMACTLLLHIKAPTASLIYCRMWCDSITFDMFR
jgi:hypothetical protein